GFVDSISLSGGTATFTPVGEAPNYQSLQTDPDDWNSRGFGYAPLTPDGALALQGYFSYGNTQDGAVGTGGATIISRLQTDGGQTLPMFFVPTTNSGATVKWASTAPLGGTLSGNVLTGSAGDVAPDGSILGVGDSVLLKDQANAVTNGIYVVTDPGGDITSAVLTTGVASSVTGTNTANKAFDNDTSTRWESTQGVDPQWLSVDLGSAKSINGVGIQWENASARDYTIQVSTDNVAWTVVSTQANLGGGGRTDTISFPTTSARYVKMNGTVRTTSYGYSIYEMNVYSSSTGTPFKLTRRADADDVPGSGSTDSGIIKGNWEVRVTRGILNYGHVFRLSSATTPTINVSNLDFTETGATPMTGGMMTPTISPDGKKIAYVTGDTDTVGTDSTAWRKGLSMVNFDQPSRLVTSKKRLLNNWVAGTGGNPVKWPFFESDSRSLVYVESTPENFCRDENSANDDGRACKESVYGNSAPTSRGRWPGSLFSLDTQAANPSATKVELSKLNDAENALDADKSYQPTVLPFASGGYRWVIFTSPRSYGNQFNQIGTHFTCGATMLWVSALDDATASTTDRSHPAFFLPGQNVLPITTQDHYLSERGYLVPNQCRSTGLSCNTSDQCCAGLACKVDTISATGVPNKVCKATGACGAVGTACLTAADCCGAGALCVADKCAAKPNYAGAASFSRDFVASCQPGFKPHWGLFEYHLTTLSDSHIAFAASTADT
ncbi:MAG TPA: discoidin domain-containing protein, partial [Polyangiaceae bacterium]|nr:discoidin domain-containing protein [Polyangiaceae bacterium]